MMPCLYNEDQHEILSGGEIIAWCKRTAPAKEKDSFFLYHHRLHGTFVVGRWVQDRAFGIFTDFFNLGTSLSNFTGEKAKEFKRRLFAPMSAPAMAKAIDQTSKDYTTIRQDEDAENKERIEKRQRGE